MKASSIQRIVIVGGGTAGWMTAALLTRMLHGNRAVEIQVIESSDIAAMGVGEATVPLIRGFNGVLGINEQDFLRHTQGTFKLGIEFRDWVKQGSSHFHFFGDFGDSIEGIAPHHHWLRLRDLGDAALLADYSLPYIAAGLNRFIPPDAKFKAAAYNYAYHFDATLYADYLRRYAESRGVKRLVANVVDVQLYAETGFINSLLVDTGERIAGDLFIDCSGFRGLLIEQALHTGYEEWTHWLPCDRAITVASERDNTLPPYTVSTAHDAGWQWRIPLQHRTGNGYVYSSQYAKDEHALQTLLRNTQENALSEPRLLKFTTGRRRLFWNKNCVAIGLAAGFMEPLESSGIQLIQTAIVRLIDMFPDMQFDPAITQEYNRLTSNEYARIRDFIILHYCVTQREDSPLWQECKSMTLPDTLQHKLDVYRACGRVPLLSEESYQEPSWMSILLGAEVFPERYDPLVDLIDPELLKRVMQQRRINIRRLAEAMPTQAAFITNYCAASGVPT